MGQLHVLGHARILIAIAAVVLLIAGEQRSVAAEGPAPAGGLTAASTPAPSSRQEPPSAEAQEHLARAREHSLAGRDDLALEQLRAAYERQPHPTILLALARTYHRLGRDADAARFYERFLQISPQGGERSAAEQEAHALAPAPSAAAPASLAHDVSIREVPATTAGTRPVWKRWWLWAGVAAVVAGATVLLLTGSSDSTAIPTTDLGNQRFFR